MLAYYGPEWESLASRMVGRWCPSFSGATGLQLPDTMGRNHGVLTGMDRNTSWVASPDKLALDFDGSNDHINLANVLNFERTDPFSISAWVRVKASPTFAIIATKMNDFAVNGRGYFFGYEPSRTITFILRSLTSGNRILVQTSSAALSLGAWGHVVVTYNGSSQASGVRIYADGLIRATTTVENTLTGTTINTQPLAFAARPVQNDGFANAQMDDFTFYNTALTANEVQFIYEQGRGGGMLYQPPRRRSYFAQVTTFKNYWFRNQQRMIGGGIR